MVVYHRIPYYDFKVPHLKDQKLPPPRLVEVRQATLLTGCKVSTTCFKRDPKIFQVHQGANEMVWGFRIE